jgi:hypothetical protein
MIFNAMNDNNIMIEVIMSVFERSGLESAGRRFQDASRIDRYARAFKPISS